MKPFFQKRLLLLAPVIGSFVFLILYVLAAFYYPGGSQADAHAKGFSWLHNYWCNLLNEKAINGEANAARPFGYAALTVLALSLVGFWAIAAQGLRFARGTRHAVLICGATSLVLLPFLPTVYHDWVINVSASAGLVVMVFIYVGIYKNGWTALFAFGLFNIFLVALNNYIYYRTSLYWLPLVQKFTFLSFLLWICGVTLKLYRQPRAA